MPGIALLLSAAALPLLLAGILPLRPALAEQWGWSGAWLFPVGDPFDYARPDPEGAGGYRVLRGTGGQGRGASAHQGADLGNGAGGGRVRAAAGGLVVRSATSGWHGGYGRHVVLAHRLPDGVVVYTVYAHLAPGSVRVRGGQSVRAGDGLGRVGRSGRATAEHLHFEVRLPRDPAERWERAPVTDPLGFVAARLPAMQADTSWARPYLLWAECSALIDSAARPDSTLGRTTWWVMLARGVRHALQELPPGPLELHEALVAAGILPEQPAPAPDDPVAWHELARDLERARELGVRLPAGPLPSTRHRELCARELGVATPIERLRWLGRRAGPPPTAAEACLALADLCASAPAPRATGGAARH